MTGEGMREDSGAALVCHCFGYTAEEIRQDYRANARSTIMEKIKMEKRFGNCRCASLNPKGR